MLNKTNSQSIARALHSARAYKTSDKHDFQHRRIKRAYRKSCPVASFSHAVQPVRWPQRAIVLEQSVEWAVQCGRHMTLETVAPLSDDPIVRLPTVAARYPAIPAKEQEPLALLYHSSEHDP